MTQDHIIKINVPGGIVSSGDLTEILVSARKCGIESFRFGNRQQIYLTVKVPQLPAIERELLTAGIEYEIDDDRHPNIISSYICAELFPATSWISEGTFKDVINLFDYSPLLKINLTDPAQCLVPYFTGHLNFVVAALSNYWHLWIRFPKTNRFFIWPTLVYTDEIASLSLRLEKELLVRDDGISGPGVLADICSAGPALVKKIQQHEVPGLIQVILPEFTAFDLPHYEGFHSAENGIWLGIYRREECFELELMIDICALALEQKINQVHTTPWKSLIIRGITKENKSSWELLLLKHEITLRHSATELNWQTEDFSPQGLELKKLLVKGLDEGDINTLGLSFAIKTRAGSGLSGTITIRQEESKGKIGARYTVEYLPWQQSPGLIPARIEKGIRKAELLGLLTQLCRDFHLQTGEKVTTPAIEGNRQNPEEISADRDILHQCGDCLTVYNQKQGDPERGIDPGTEFSTLPDYKCPTCDSLAAAFVRL